MKNRWVLGFLAGSAISLVVLLIGWAGNQLMSLGVSKSAQTPQPSPSVSESPIAPLTQDNGGLPRTLIPNPPASPSPSPSAAAATQSPTPTLPAPNLGAAKALPVLNPNRVQFAKGSNQAQLTGNLDSLLTQPFLVECRQGQVLTIAPGGANISVDVFSPSGIYLGSTSVNPDQRWSSQLAESGTYRIEVNVSTSGPYKVDLNVS